MNNAIVLFSNVLKFRFPGYFERQILLKPAIGMCVCVCGGGGVAGGAYAASQTAVMKTHLISMISGLAERASQFKNRKEHTLQFLSSS